MKILLLGDGAVGKTSLVHRFVEGQFKDRYKATIGVDIFSKEAGGKELQIWDLSGQAHFTAVRSKFYAKAEAGLLCFDLTSKKSFDNLNSWIEEVKNSVGTEIPMVIIGNKMDLTDLIDVTDDEINTYAENKGFKFMKTSAKDGTNVEEAFTAVASL